MLGNVLWSGIFLLYWTPACIILQRDKDLRVELLE